MEKLAVERSIWINAPRERVWQAITDPKQIQQWFSPGTPWHLTTLDVGGKLYALGYESQAGIIEVVDSPRQFTYRWETPTPDIPFTLTTTYTLEEENGGTRVTITETGFESLLEDTRQERVDQNGKSWGMALENLKAYLEGRSLPYPEGL
ncbi:MAG: SRPBCC domain-containing protein [Chloroflexi bacterium]|nr:SRPBCC domain-containing protein [Chloroflexota bacterium]